jgi:hypothetical protein
MPHHGWEQPGPDERTRALPTRRKRRWRPWLIALVVLLAVLVGADRIGLAVAQDELASRIQSSQHLSRKPDVSIDGFPFLTQVAQRHFGHATVDMHGLDVNGLTVSDLHTDLYGVHVNGAFDGAEVDLIKADATIDYSAISSLISQHMSVGGVQLGTVKVGYAGNGELQASASAPSALSQLVGGALLSVKIHVAIVGPNVIELRSDQVSSVLADLGFSPDFDLKFDLSALPFAFSLTGLSYSATAVHVSGQGQHVSLSRGGVSGG